MPALVAVLTLIAFFAGACATGPKTVRDEESVLRERAEAFWAAKAKGDWVTAEAYIDPDMRPDLDPYLKELKNGPHYVDYKSIRISEVKIRGGEADVSVDYSVKWTHPLLAGVPVQDRQTKETWRKNKGVWYVMMGKPDPSKAFQRLSPKDGGG